MCLDLSVIAYVDLHADSCCMLRCEDKEDVVVRADVTLILF